MRIVKLKVSLTSRTGFGWQKHDKVHHVLKISLACCLINIFVLLCTPSATRGWHHAWRQAFVTLSWCTVSNTLDGIRELRIFFILLLVRRGRKNVCYRFHKDGIVSWNYMFLVVRDRGVMNAGLDLNEWMPLSVSCILIHWRPQTGNVNFWEQLLTSKERPAWS